MIRLIMEYLDKQSGIFFYILGFLLIAFIGASDYITGAELSFSIFYLIPIALITWFSGRRAGVIISIVSAITWLIVDLTYGPTYSHPIIHYWNMIVTFGFFVIVTLSLSALKTALEVEKKLARTDTLTRVANIRYFIETINAEINRARRYKHPITVAYLDLDNFKSVNDHFGHSTGDLLLQTVAGIIQENIRQTDLAARFGGDEFVLLLTEMSAEHAQVVVDRIHKSLLEAMQNKGWPVTVSIGVVSSANPPPHAEVLIKRADMLMYAVKNAGKNMVKYEVMDYQEENRR